jgi:hypothetical protein
MSSNFIFAARRTGRTLDAMCFDGSPDSARAISAALPEATVQINRGFLEIATAFGRDIARAGQWILRDQRTGSVRVLDAAAFEAWRELLAV